jgi:hypothetical protein
MTTTTTSTHGEKVSLPEREKEICVLFLFSLAKFNLHRRVELDH